MGGHGCLRTPVGPVVVENRADPGRARWLASAAYRPAIIGGDEVDAVEYLICAAGLRTPGVAIVGVDDQTRAISSLSTPYSWRGTGWAAHRPPADDGGRGGARSGKHRHQAQQKPSRCEQR